MGKQKFDDLELISALNCHNGNISRAAKELGVSRAAVKKRLDALPSGVIVDDVEKFRAKRADTFAELQQILLRYITPEKLKKASLQQIGTLFGIMYDKERLERGQATEHIAHAHFQKLDDEDRLLLRRTIKEMTQRKIESTKKEY